MLTSQVQPNNLTFPSLIKAACSSFSVYYGVSLHGQALKRGVMITPNEATLKNGEKFFNEGFSPHGHPVVITPNEATLVSVLSSCANLDRGGVRLGKQIHGYVLRREMILTTTLGTALLHMYGKAGHLEIALTIFDQIPDKEVCTWNAIISTLASNACARSNLVDIGIKLFTSLCSEYKIIPTSEHYGCMVDLIGRAGLLVDAVSFVKKLPFEPDTSVLGALLGACKIHEDVELGNKVGKWLIELQPHHCGQYVALSTLNALESKWAEAEQMRKVMIQAGIRKIHAYSVLS